MALDTYDTFQWYDYVIFAVTLAISLGIGVYYALTGDKQRTTKEFLLANRSMGTFPVALSVYVSGVSAILILGSTAEVYEYGVTQYFAVFGGALGIIFCSYVLVPIFYGMGYTSSFTYLERRFQSKILRLAGSVFFLLQSAVYMGLAMYSPAIALEGVTGIPLIASILATGIVVVIYTTIGGMKAVIGTDAFQGLVMIGGCLLVLILGSLKIDGGIAEAWAIANAGHRLDVDFTPTPFVRVSFWTSFIGAIPSYIAYNGISQPYVQRIISTGSTKEARNVYLWNIPLSIVMYTMVYLCGIVVYAYYEQIGCDPLQTEQITSSNQLLPYFIMSGLKIPCIPGLFTAVLFCGALSSVSSALNSMAAVTWKDFFEWKFIDVSEFKKANINKLFGKEKVFTYGVVGIIFAFLFAYGKGNVLQMANTVFGSIIGPIGGTFLLGMLFPWANWIGALIGLLFGFGFTAAITIGQSLTYPWGEHLPTTLSECEALGFNVTNPGLGENTEVFPLFMISFNWYYMIALFLSVGVGLIASLIVRCISNEGDVSDSDPRLLAPVFDWLCCCFPNSCREPLKCGVPYADIELDELGKYDMTGIEETKVQETGNGLVVANQKSVVDKKILDGFENTVNVISQTKL